MVRMRAAVAESVPGEPVIADLEVDEPGLGEVLVRVTACGVCHSDVHALQGHVMVFPVPFVVGHEPAGVVEAVGPGVRHVSVGDHVVACLSVFCGHCAHCVVGDTQRCVRRDEFARPRTRLRAFAAATKPSTSSAVSAGSPSTCWSVRTIW